MYTNKQVLHLLIQCNIWTETVAVILHALTILTLALVGLAVDWFSNVMFCPSYLVDMLT